MSERSRRRVLSQQERVLWAAATKAIKPLHAITPNRLDQEVAGHADAVQPPPARAASSAPVPDAPLALLGRRLRHRVARGKLAIDARLDLHGLTQNEAHAVLLRFLRNAQMRGARLVLLITGKGVRGEGEPGVLKRQVPHWLEAPEFRAYVVGFQGAHAAHGGEGALYVWVRRARV
jgi:DNA-nicking Smr family endonuclease